MSVSISIQPFYTKRFICSVRLTMLERDIDKGHFVCMSVCHIRDPHIDGSRCQNISQPFDRAMFLVS